MPRDASIFRHFVASTVRLCQLNARNFAVPLLLAHRCVGEVAPQRPGFVPGSAPSGERSLLPDELSHDSVPELTITAVSSGEIPCSQLGNDDPGKRAEPDDQPDDSSPGRQLTIVIPCYNEQQRLPTTLEILRSTLDSWQIDYRVIVVDDGSRDHTAALVAGFSPRFSSIKLSRNSGKGAAVKTGMLSSDSAVVAFTDADLGFGLEPIRRAYYEIAAGRFDALFGDRTHPETHSFDQPRRSLARQLAGAVFRSVVRLLISPSVRDTQCGLKVFSADASRAIFSRLNTTGFAFDIEVICRADSMRMRTAAIPVEIQQSALSTVSLRRHVLPMLRETLRIRSELMTESGVADMVFGGAALHGCSLTTAMKNGPTGGSTAGDMQAAESHSPSAGSTSTTTTDPIPSQPDPTDPSQRDAA